MGCAESRHLRHRLPYLRTELSQLKKVDIREDILRATRNSFITCRSNPFKCRLHRLPDNHRRPDNAVSGLPDGRRSVLSCRPGKQADQSNRSIEQSRRGQAKTPTGFLIKREYRDQLPSRSGSRLRLLSAVAQANGSLSITHAQARGPRTDRLQTVDPAFQAKIP